MHDNLVTDGDFSTLTAVPQFYWFVCAPDLSFTWYYVFNVKTTYQRVAQNIKPCLAKKMPSFSGYTKIKH